MGVTNPQAILLGNGLRASTDPNVQQAIIDGDEAYLTDWSNVVSTTAAWNEVTESGTMTEAMTISKFIALGQGNRDAYTLLVDNAPIDYTRQKMRNALVDIWGNTDSVSVLENIRTLATRGQEFIGGPVRTTNTVSAIARSYPESISGQDISLALQLTAP